MDRIKEGIIEIDGVELTADMTLEDVEKVDFDKAVLREHPGGISELLFNRPIENDGVTFQVALRINRRNKKLILLDPKLKQPMNDIKDESREKQEICEEWLKRNMGVPPARDTDDGIFYDFPWGHVYCSAAEHIHFGRVKGCILVTYGDDVV